MIHNAVYINGMVAVRYFEPSPKYVTVNGHEYVASVKRGVAIVFADEADVPALLAYEGGCCGGRRKVFSLCSEHAYRVFDTGER